MYPINVVNFFTKYKKQIVTIACSVFVGCSLGVLALLVYLIHLVQQL